MTRLAKPVSKTTAVLIWGGAVFVLAIPLIIAANSPLLQWREPIYILAGFAGVVGLAALMVQPALAAGWMPWISLSRSRMAHRIIGAVIFIAVVVHVAALWITSPPDVVDVLLFRSPTPFSIWGAVAMWAVFASAAFATFRKRLRVPPRIWRRVHLSLATLIVVCTVVHALQIDGTMGTISKSVACAVALIGLACIIWEKSRPSRL